MKVVLYDTNIEKDIFVYIVKRYLEDYVSSCILWYIILGKSTKIGLKTTRLKTMPMIAYTDICHQFFHPHKCIWTQKVAWVIGTVISISN